MQKLSTLIEEARSGLSLIEAALIIDLNKDALPLSVVFDRFEAAGFTRIPPFNEPTSFKATVKVAGFGEQSFSVKRRRGYYFRYEMDKPKGFTEDIYVQLYLEAMVLPFVPTRSDADAARWSTGALLMFEQVTLYVVLDKPREYAAALGWDASAKTNLYLNGPERFEDELNLSANPGSLDKVVTLAVKKAQEQIAALNDAVVAAVAVTKDIVARRRTMWSAVASYDGNAIKVVTASSEDDATKLAAKMKKEMKFDVVQHTQRIGEPVGSVNMLV